MKYPARFVSRLFLVLVAASLLGCTQRTTFPEPVHTHSAAGETTLAFDTTGDGLSDYWQYQSPDGRKHAIAYADATGAASSRIELDALASDACPHLVIFLDGVPFEVVQELYGEGCFRFFYPPARVITCYPVMTDLALSDLLHTLPCQACQARYFDPEKNRISNGNATYLEATNSPWVAKTDYRCSFWWDANAYLDPKAVFRHELKGIEQTFAESDKDEVITYSVGTAGLGTRGGREGIRTYLRQIDAFCERIIHERHGQVKITLAADHGQNLTVNERISFRKHLESCGYRQAKSLRKPNDVVAVGYGLVTYAAFFAADRAGVAACLAQHEDAEFACYVEGDDVVVRDRDGEAHIRKCETGFAYDAVSSDPLQLAPILDTLRESGSIGDDGAINSAALFAATLDHKYPDPLDRIWRAFHEVVELPPDVIVNLRDGACYGSKFFAFMIGEVTSTHGSLNRVNSTTFMMSMLGPLPPAMRAREAFPALQALRKGTVPAQ